MMRKILNQIDQEALQMIHEVGEAADKQGIRTYLVGGFVRDLILGLPNVDVDVVLEGDAVEFALTLAQQKALPVKAHQRFRTATVDSWKGLHVDFVTARSETYPQAGSLPVVQPSDLKEDLFRRDFTINAIAVSINEKDFGEVFDLYDGLDDLKQGMIRVFHDQSFLDDPTRIFRAVRFEQRLGFRLASRTRRLLGQAIDSHACRAVTPPRLYQEFARGFSEPHPVKYLKRLRQLDLLEFLGIRGFPEENFGQQMDRQVKRWRESKHWEDVVPKVLYAAAFFSSLSAEKVKELADRFQWARLEKKKILEIISQ